jgi:hypothetical protein
MTPYSSPCDGSQIRPGVANRDGRKTRMGDAMSISWLWVPGLSVGPFQFGDVAASVIRSHRLVKLERDYANASWDTYEVPGCESRVSVENGEISGVLCCDSLKYKEVDLLGRTPEEIRALLGHEDELEENVGLGEALYYDELGLTLFVANGVSRSATCNAPVMDE